MSAVLLPWPAPVRPTTPGAGPVPDGGVGERVDALLTALTSLGRVVVAFSGGADSAFVLTAAVRALGAGSVTAATAVSDSLPATELAAAAAFAAALGVTHLTPATHELDRPGYRANDGDRCYHCKAELLDVLSPLARARGAVVVTGTNADDVAAGFRPGIRAGFERGARTPLADAGLRKSEIRAVSRDWGLVTADKPAAACLSSRVAYGIAIDPARLARVDAAETAARAVLVAAGLVVGDLRVRDLGDSASIEVDAELVAAAAGLPELVARVRSCGFDSAAVDARGFRSGSMNERLAVPELFR
jgi:uncharacterized protein